MMGKEKRSFEEARKSPYYKAQSKILSFVSQIEEILDKRKINQKQLAEKMGVSSAYISKLLNCNVNISLITMEKVATALELELSEINLVDNSFCCIDKRIVDWNKFEQLKTLCEMTKAVWQKKEFEQKFEKVNDCIGFELEVNTKQNWKSDTYSYIN